MNRVRVAILLLGLSLSGFAAETERMLVKDVIVNAPLDDVWQAWTTADGLKFISEESNVVLERGGPYEWFLDLPRDANAAHVTLVAHEWGEGEAWDAGYAYFDVAWDAVLNALKAHFED